MSTEQEWVAERRVARIEHTIRAQGLSWPEVDHCLVWQQTDEQGGAWVWQVGNFYRSEPTTPAEENGYWQPLPHCHGVCANERLAREACLAAQAAHALNAHPYTGPEWAIGSRGRR